jgi:hypothetical protein
MVRKWSYLKTFSLEHPSTLVPIKTVKAFKVFRKTTRFKKYNRGITRIVRRKYMKRKRKSSSLFAYYITKSWVQSYLKLRQFERFYQSFGSSRILSYAADYDVFKVAPHCINDHGIHIFSCSKSLLNHFINPRKLIKSPLVFTNFKNSKLTYIQTDSLETTSQSNLAYPIATRLDNSNYHPITEDITQQHTLNVIKQLHYQQFKSSLHFCQATRHLLTLLTLKNICNK